MQKIHILSYFYNKNSNGEASELPFYVLNDSGLHVMLIYLSTLQSCDFLMTP